MTNMTASIWLGEARAHLHAAVATMDEPQQRRVHAAKAFDYAMKVLIDDAERSELDYATLFTEEAVGHLTGAVADGATEDATV